MRAGCEEAADGRFRAVWVTVMRPDEDPAVRLAALAAALRGIGQTLEGSFSAVSKPQIASKYAFESSRRDLHNEILCTALQSQSFVKNVDNNFAKILKNSAANLKLAIFEKHIRNFLTNFEQIFRKM